MYEEDIVHSYEVGQTVMWRGSWGTQAPKAVKIIDLGSKNGEPVYDLDNEHWCYEDQIDRVISG